MTNPDPDPPQIVPAAPELLELAARMRPKWDIDALQGALIAARAAGWTWERTFGHVALLLTDPAGEPRQLLDACRNPIRHQPGVPANDNFRQALRDTFPQAVTSGAEQ